MCEPTFDEHAVTSRTGCRAWGLADCIHYAPNWHGRADGRMALINSIVCIFEPPW